LTQEPVCYTIQALLNKRNYMSAALLAQRKSEVIAKVKACVEKGNELYGITLPKLDVRFDLRGRAAGMACRRGSQYYIRFNRDMLTRDAWEHIINNTVPHEVAHSFCFMNPALGSGHNSGWERVCEALGGNGTRCHKEEVVYGKGYTYEYTTDRGHTVRVGDKYHAHVQRGMQLSFKRGMGAIHKHSPHSIVGHQGRTLANPIVQVPAGAAAPVQAIVPASPRPVDPQVTAARGSFTIGIAAPVVRTPTVAMPAGASKAALARAIMLSEHTRGETYENIITAIMHATGHDRQLARATYKANYMKVGCPVQ
jgi:predicted SprT family Zn-dependent metalloprotease